MNKIAIKYNFVLVEAFYKTDQTLLSDRRHKLFLVENCNMVFGLIDYQNRKVTQHALHHSTKNTAYHATIFYSLEPEDFEWVDKKITVLQFDTPSNSIFAKHFHAVVFWKVVPMKIFH